jgi:hypothetical protein
MVLDRKQRLLAACSRRSHLSMPFTTGIMHAGSKPVHAAATGRNHDGAATAPGDIEAANSCVAGSSILNSIRLRSMMDEGNSAEDTFFSIKKPRNLRRVSVTSFRCEENLSKKAYKHRQ